MSNRRLAGRAGKHCPYENRPIICQNIEGMPCHYCLGATHGTYKRDWIMASGMKHHRTVIELGGRLWDEVRR
jgi:hypothetical protein